MKLTAEISLYPLTENFEQVVIDYISLIKKHKDIRVEVNGLSTQVFGDYDHVMKVLTEVNKSTFLQNKCVVMMKMAQGELTVDNLPPVLK